jgi:hypothetical protein
VQSSLEDIAYAQRIGRLRDFYLAVAPELEPYVLVVPAPHAEAGCTASTSVRAAGS